MDFFSCLIYSEVFFSHCCIRHVHGKRVLVVTNKTVAPLYLDKVVDALTRGNPNVSVESVILPDGEQYKDMVSLVRKNWLWCFLPILVIA